MIDPAGEPWGTCEECGTLYPFASVMKHDCDGNVAIQRALYGPNKDAQQAMHRMTPGRVHALFMTGASIAELARMFCMLETEIEAALRKHIARRERERKT